MTIKEKKQLSSIISNTQELILDRQNKQKENDKRLDKLKPIIDGYRDLENPTAEETAEYERAVELRKALQTENSIYGAEEKEAIGRLTELQKKLPQQERVLKNILDIATTGFGIYVGAKDVLPTNDYFKVFRKNLFDKMTKK